MPRKVLVIDDKFLDVISLSRSEIQTPELIDAIDEKMAKSGLKWYPQFKKYLTKLRDAPPPRRR